MELFLSGQGGVGSGGHARTRQSDAVVVDAKREADKRKTSSKIKWKEVKQGGVIKKKIQPKYTLAKRTEPAVPICTGKREDETYERWAYIQACHVQVILDKTAITDKSKGISAEYKSKQNLRDAVNSYINLYDSVNRYDHDKRETYVVTNCYISTHKGNKKTTCNAIMEVLQDEEKMKTLGYNLEYPSGKCRKNRDYIKFTTFELEPANTTGTVEDPDKKRRLAEDEIEKLLADFSSPVRRLAAIPLAGEPVDNVQELAQPAKSYALPVLGLVSAAFVCIGCAIKRKFKQVKKQLIPVE